MPVLKHLDGNCHIYIDAAANFDMARRVIVNAKTRRYGVCSAAESLLIHAKIAAKLLPSIAADLRQHGVEIRGCNKTQKIIAKCRPATTEDWSTEYLDAKISVKTVKNVNEAINHILKYGTMHTDSIITNSSKNAKIFLEGVNSSIAMHNVSTQFADGAEFGFGGEIGISTNKLPPRGPVGINQLTSYKYLVSGNGITRP